MKLIQTLALLLLFATLLSGDILAQIPPPNYQISSPSIQLQNEEQVFYSAVDGKYVMATWRDFRLGYRRCGIGVSSDGGANWTNFLNNLLIDVDSRQSDPTMTVSADGTFYLSFLDYSQTTFNSDSSWIIFIKSTDNGQTFTGPYQHTPSHGAWFEDKQFITCDRTGGPYDGNVYVGWARFPNPTRIMFVRSTDGCATFSDTMIVGTPTYHEPCGQTFDAGQFTQPIVGSDGSVYVIWRGIEFVPDVCEGYGAFLMSKSTDGGQTWPIMNQPIFRYNGVYSADGGIDIYNAAAGDADITGGPFDGNIYISTVNGQLDDLYYHADVVMIKSTDGGATWSEPLRINDDPVDIDVDQFHPWLVVNQDGVVVVIFYDQRLDVNHYLFDVFAAYSFDGGETFTTNHRVTEVSSSPSDLKMSSDIGQPTNDAYEGQFDEDGQYHILSPMAGKIAEYIGVTANHDSITAVWTDARNGNQDVFGATYVIPFMEPRLFAVANASFIDGVNDTLLWSACWHAGDVSYRLEIDNNSDFSSPEVVESSSGNKYGNLGLLGDGIFFWRVKAFRTTEGDSTIYSATWTFEIDSQAPAAVTLLLPSDGAVITDTLPTLIWATAKDATEYFNLEVSSQASFSGDGYYLSVDGLSSTSYALTTGLAPESTYYWRINHYDLAGNETGFTAPFSFDLIAFVCGDANGDGAVNIGDAVFVINYVFNGGAAPDPYLSGDANEDGSVNIADAVYIINFVFKGGPAPCGP